MVIESGIYLKNFPVVFLWAELSVEQVTAGELIKLINHCN